MISRRAKAWIACIAWTASALGACGPEEGGQLALKLTVARQALGTRAEPQPPGEPPADIDTFRICVSKSGGERLTCKTFGSPAANVAYRIDGIPQASNLVVSFQGYMAGEEVALWCGKANGVEVRHKETTRVQMMLSRCGDFTSTLGELNIARAFHSASLILDGSAVLLGGFDQEREGSCSHPCRELVATGSAEIYDPGSGEFVELAPMTHPRGLHAAMALPDKRVLVVGGCEVASLQSSFEDSDLPGSPLRCIEPGMAAQTAEIYNPVTESSHAEEIPFTLFATPIPIGEDKLLLVGGQDETGAAINRALLIHIDGSLFDLIKIESPLDQPRRAATAAVFSGEGDEAIEALLVGGMAAPEWYDPGPYAERLVFQSDSLRSGIPRFVEEVVGEGLPIMHACAARVGPGHVLICGGIYPGRFDSLDEPFLPKPLHTTALADLALDSLEVLDEQDRLATPRVFHTCTPLGSGTALVAGGFEKRDPDAVLHHAATDSAEWWDDGEAAFSLRWVGDSPASMSSTRAGHSATRMADDTVLVAGGTDGNFFLVSAELFNPASARLDEPEEDGEKD
ncbi:MAG: hypothetical protein JXR96_10505 [Deltaproteobacteria bacterium]|nr:hypothetical protein [Deltaproteobacteria bacterium]